MLSNHVVQLLQFGGAVSPMVPTDHQVSRRPIVVRGVLRVGPQGAPPHVVLGPQEEGRDDGGDDEQQEREADGPQDASTDRRLPPPPHGQGHRRGLRGDRGLARCKRDGARGVAFGRRGDRALRRPNLLACGGAAGHGHRDVHGRPVAGARAGHGNGPRGRLRGRELLVESRAVREPILRPLCEAPHDDRGVLGRHLGVELVGSGWHIVEVPVAHDKRRWPVERELAREKLIAQDPDGIDVAGLPRVALELLGRHVVDRAHDHAGGHGEPLIHGEDLRDPEVGELDV